MAECSVVTPKATNYPLLELYTSIASKRESGQRYTSEEKDMALYQFLLAGNKYYQFLGGNIPGMSRSTLTRHLNEHTHHIQEGMHVCNYKIRCPT